MDTPTSPAWLDTIRHLLNYISSFGVLIPLGIGLRRWKFLSLPARIIVGYFGFWALEAFVDRWSRVYLHTNVYLQHVTVLVETWLLGWAYYCTYDLKPIRRLLLPLGGVFTLVALADAFWISGLNQLNTVARSVQVVLMLLLILLYFEQWIREMSLDSPWQNLMFTTSVGLAIYYASSVMSYLSLATGGFAGSVMSIVIDSAYTVALVLMTIGLWRDKPLRVEPFRSAVTA